MAAPCGCEAFNYGERHRCLGWLPIQHTTLDRVAALFVQITACARAWAHVLLVFLFRGGLIIASVGYIPVFAKKKAKIKIKVKINNQN